MARMADVRAQMTRMDTACTQAGISPGGCADLLAMTLLAHFAAQPNP